MAPLPVPAFGAGVIDAHHNQGRRVAEPFEGISARIKRAASTISRSSDTSAGIPAKLRIQRRDRTSLSNSIVTTHFFHPSGGFF